MLNNVAGSYNPFIPSPDYLIMPILTNLKRNLTLRKMIMRLKVLLMIEKVL